MLQQKEESWQLTGSMDTGFCSMFDLSTTVSKVAKLISEVNAPVQLVELRRAFTSADSCAVVGPLVTPAPPIDLYLNNGPFKSYT